MSASHPYRNASVPLGAGARSIGGERGSEGCANPSSDELKYERMEQQRKDDFLSMASHELKTPITTLRAFLQLFSSSDGPEVIVPKKHLKKMSDQVDRLTRLVGDLLEVSKIQRGQIEFADEPIDLEYLVHQVVANARSGHTTHHFLLQGSVDAKVRGDR